MVITVTFGAQFLAGAMSGGAMLVLMASNYLFKLCAALADTLPFYAGVHYLKKYLVGEHGEIAVELPVERDLLEHGAAERAGLAGDAGANDKR